MKQRESLLRLRPILGISGAFDPPYSGLRNKNDRTNEGLDTAHSCLWLVGEGGDISRR
jgi:hypothetical protein